MPRTLQIKSIKYYRNAFEERKREGVRGSTWRGDILLGNTIVINTGQPPTQIHI